MLEWDQYNGSNGLTFNYTFSTVLQVNSLSLHFILDFNVLWTSMDFTCSLVIIPPMIHQDAETSSFSLILPSDQSFYSER